MHGMSTPEPVPATVVPGHDVLSLVAVRGGRLHRVRAPEPPRRGPSGADAVFGNCHGDLFDFDALLAFFERKGKIARTGNEVALGAVPACSGH